MNINLIGRVGGGQDGAIWKNELFRFNTNGKCDVYNLLDLNRSAKELKPTASFFLDDRALIVPHSNAVCWGVEFYEQGDEYPLLYSNIYNNYAKSEDKLIGVCCVYRVQRTKDSFKATLVQLIEIGFCSNSDHWRAYPDKDGVRPYGNFLIDRENGQFYAFVMRSEELGTAYFRFDVPKLSDGKLDEKYGVNRVVLGLDDVQTSFRCPYHRFIQGATVYDGKIYYTEGFSNDEVNRPAIRVISLAAGKQIGYYDLTEKGIFEEAELIDFYNGICHYSDAHGSLYTIDFQDL